jgi:hypothetical protein
MEFFVSSTGVLVALWSALTVVLLLILYKSNIRFGAKMLMVPLTFFMLYYTIAGTVDLLGKPYHGMPEGEFMIVAHRVIAEKGDDVTIVLWTQIKREHRLWQFVTDKETAKKLRQAKKRRKGTGIPQMGNFRPKKKKGDKKPAEISTSPWKDFQVYDFPFQELMPKEPLN